MKRATWMLAALTLLLGGVEQAEGSVINVGYIEADGDNISYLTNYGMNVTNINNPIGLTIGDLASYNAIVIASNAPFSDPTGIGNVAKQFAQAGHGVVLTEFTFQGQWQLQGGIMDSGYSPFTVDPLSNDYFISSNLGTIQQPGSSLLNGVNPSNVSTQFQANVGLDTGATLVADWTSGRHAIAYNSLGNSSVVGLNLFPDSLYTTNSATQELVANAVIFSLDPHPNSVVPEPSSLALLSTAFATFAGCFGWRRRKSVVMA